MNTYAHIRRAQTRTRCVLVLPAFTHGNVCRRQQNNQGNTSQEWQRKGVLWKAAYGEIKKKRRDTPILTPAALTPMRTPTDKYIGSPVQSNLRISVIKIKGFSLKTIPKSPWMDQKWRTSRRAIFHSYDKVRSFIRSSNEVRLRRLRFKDQESSLAAYVTAS